MLVRVHKEIDDSVMVYEVKSTMSAKVRNAGVASGTSMEASSTKSNDDRGAGVAVKPNAVAPETLALLRIVIEPGTVTAVADIERSF